MPSAPMPSVPMPVVTLYHNPQCGTSRNTLGLIRNAGVEPVIIEYLTQPPDRDTLKDLITQAGLSVRDAIRVKGTPYHELGLADTTLSDDALLDAMLAHPILINRPFVVTEHGVRLCRPSERVLQILPRPQRDVFVKEDGGQVFDVPLIDTALIAPASSDDDHAAHDFRNTGDTGDAGDTRDTVDIATPDAATARSPTFTFTHRPRILLLYGSLRERSYSRLLTEEAARILQYLGADTRIFDPAGLPLPDSVGRDHPKVAELLALSTWSEGQVWCSPERHGTLTGILKSQIDWLPLESGGIRPTQGRTLAVMQVSGGSQSFNAVNAMRVLGRWMRMITIPNQSSVAKAYQEFDDRGRMKPSAYYDRVVDVMEELIKFTCLTRDRSAWLTDRYSERKETVARTDEKKQADASREQPARILQHLELQSSRSE